MHLLQLTILSVFAVIPLICGQDATTSSLNPIPSLDPNKIILQLCTRDNINGVRLPNNGSTTLLNVGKPTVFLIHGWTDSMFTPWMVNAALAYLTKEDINVIKVDWSYYADNLLYPLARAQVGPVGNLVGNFIIGASQSNTNGFLNQIHIVGHSMGAHVAGFAGQRVEAGLNAKIKRITGLDAAAPLFDESPADERLSPGDAITVDGIHSNDGNFGLTIHYADIDFYPNGGIAPQPSCVNLNTIICSHRFSTVLFVSSITTDQFIAVACPSYHDFLTGLCRGNTQAVMGEMLNFDSSDVDDGYYLLTSGNSPYALGDTHLIS